MKQRQQGYILAVALILLFIMTGLGVNALSNMSLNTRVSNNVETMSECFNSVDGAVSIARKDSNLFSDIFDSFGTNLTAGIADLYVSNESDLISDASSSVSERMNNLENIKVYSRLISRATNCPRARNGSSIDLWQCDYVEVVAINTTSRCSGVGGAKAGLARMGLK